MTRRFVIVSLLLLTVVIVGSWLVLPMFVAPKAATLVECGRCPELLALVPARAPKVLIVPQGGTTLFDIGRRIVPSTELRELLAAPGLLAIGLGTAPIVVWQDEEGELGAAAAPAGPRGLVFRAATSIYSVHTLRWRGGLVLFGGESEGGGRAALERLEPVGDRRAHGFAFHDSPAGRSVANLSPKSLEITTFPDSGSIGSARQSRHPGGAMISLASANLREIVGPVEKILPLKTGAMEARAGQIVVYGVKASGLLPSVRGMLLIEGDDDPRAALEAAVPRVDGATIDTTRKVGAIDVHRRETLGIVVESASRDGWLAFAFDDSSMDRWLSDDGPLESVPAAWSVVLEPGPLARSLDELVASPARALLGSSARRTIRRLRDTIGPLRNAREIRSRLVDGAGGPVIETRVEW